MTRTCSNCKHYSEGYCDLTAWATDPDAPVEDECLVLQAGFGPGWEPITWDCVRDRIENDERRIVTCGDCSKTAGSPKEPWCMHFRTYVDPWGFCAWGERKES